MTLSVQKTIDNLKLVYLFYKLIEKDRNHNRVKFGKLGGIAYYSINTSSEDLN